MALDLQATFVSGCEYPGRCRGGQPAQTVTHQPMKIQKSGNSPRWLFSGRTDSRVSHSAVAEDPDQKTNSVGAAEMGMSPPCFLFERPTNIH